MKLLRLLWALIGDDRLCLLIAGGIVVVSVQDLAGHQYVDAICNAAFALFIGGASWLSISIEREAAK